MVVESAPLWVVADMVQAGRYEVVLVLSENQSVLGLVRSDAVLRLSPRLPEAPVRMLPLQRALVVRQPGPGLVHHSDQGTHYTGEQYQAGLARVQALASYSRRGDCWDNAVVESFFATLKTELVRDAHWLTRTQARAELAAYLDGWYNYERRHSSLGYLSPVDYERQHHAA